MQAVGNISPVIRRRPLLHPFSVRKAASTFLVGCPIVACSIFPRMTRQPALDDGDFGLTTQLLKPWRPASQAKRRWNIAVGTCAPGDLA